MMVVFGLRLSFLFPGNGPLRVLKSAPFPSQRPSKGRAELAAPYRIKSAMMGFSVKTSSN